MVQRVHRRLGVGLAFPSNVADAFFLLGVNADHRVARPEVGRLDRGDVLKLRVPVGMRPRAFLLAHAALPQAVFPHELAHRRPAGRRSIAALPPPAVCSDPAPHRIVFPIQLDHPTPYGFRIDLEQPRNVFAAAMSPASLAQSPRRAADPSPTTSRTAAAS